MVQENLGKPIGSSGVVETAYWMSSYVRLSGV